MRESFKTEREVKEREIEKRKVDEIDGFGDDRSTIKKKGKKEKVTINLRCGGE